ncbi:hypothetical protein ACNOYE_32535 [Nannocystaceae bacterium ST9]
MSETPDDEYLWTASGPVELELARIERELATLRWRPTPLRLPVATHEQLVVLVEPQRLARPSPRSRGWPAITAGLAMAAVLAIAFHFARRPNDVERPAGESTPAPTIQPAGPPTPSHLVDPFAPTPRPHTKAGELLDPFAATNEQTPTPPTHSDLKDPFSGSDARSFDKPAPQPSTSSPDLKDPFGNSREESTQSRHGELVDPFGRAPDEPRGRSGDLVDPFARER